MTAAESAMMLRPDSEAKRKFDYFVSSGSGCKKGPSESPCFAQFDHNDIRDFQD